MFSFLFFNSPFKGSDTLQSCKSHILKETERYATYRWQHLNSFLYSSIQSLNLFTEDSRKAGAYASCNQVGLGLHSSPVHPRDRRFKWDKTSMYLCTHMQDIVFLEKGWVKYANYTKTTQRKASSQHLHRKSCCEQTALTSCSKCASKISDLYRCGYLHVFEILMHIHTILDVSWQQYYI